MTQASQCKQKYQLIDLHLDERPLYQVSSSSLLSPPSCPIAHQQGRMVVAMSPFTQIKSIIFTESEYRRIPGKCLVPSFPGPYLSACTNRQSGLSGLQHVSNIPKDASSLKPPVNKDTCVLQQSPLRFCPQDEFFASITTFSCLIGPTATSDTG